MAKITNKRPAVARNKSAKASPQAKKAVARNKSAKASPQAKKVAAKKVAPAAINKRAATRKDGKDTDTGIKYADKSAGQPELVPIFDAIKAMLLPYAGGAMKIRGGSGGQMILVNEKPVEIAGRKRDELWFAAALIQKGYVGLYFMPATTTEERKQIFQPELLKCLKGKGCFHIKKADAVIYRQIESALEAGLRKYKERGLI